MKIALLICAKPALDLQAPIVYIPTGVWRVTTEKILNTEFSVVTSAHNFWDESSQDIGDKNRLINGPCSAKIQIDKVGTEKYINIYLEQIRE